MEHIFVHPTGLVRRQLQLQALCADLGEGPASGHQVRALPVNSIQTVLRRHRRVHQLHAQAMPPDRVWQAQLYHLLFAIIQNDIVVTLHQVKTTAGQRVRRPDFVARKLVGQGLTKAPTELRLHLQLILTSAFAVIRPERHQRDRCPVQTRGHGFRVTL